MNNLARIDRLAAEEQQRAIEADDCGEDDDGEDDDDPAERAWRRAEYLADQREE